MILYRLRMEALYREQILVEAPSKEEAKRIVMEGGDFDTQRSEPVSRFIVTEIKPYLDGDPTNDENWTDGSADGEALAKVSAKLAEIGDLVDKPRPAVLDLVREIRALLHIR